MGGMAVIGARRVRLACGVVNGENEIIEAKVPEKKQRHNTEKREK